MLSYRPKSLTNRLEAIKNVIQQDFLIEFVGSLGLKSTLFSRSHLRAPWGLFQDTLNEMCFHYLVEGECYLWMDNADSEPIHLRSGDFVLLPDGASHGLASATNVPLPSKESICFTIKQDRYRFLDGPGKESRFLCGSFTTNKQGTEVLLRSLPKVFVIHLDDSPEKNWIKSTLRLVEHETSQRMPGQELVITHLLDVLFLQILRWSLDSKDLTMVGLLGAIRNPELCAVVKAILEDIRHPWQLRELAEIAGLSRATFAERFAKVVGESPMAFLRTERLRRSVALLETGDLSVKEVANRVGFSRVEIFIRSFERAYGVSPNKHRTRVLAGAAAC